MRLLPSTSAPGQIKYRQAAKKNRWGLLCCVSGNLSLFSEISGLTRASNFIFIEKEL